MTFAFSARVAIGGAVTDLAGTAQGAQGVDAFTHLLADTRRTGIAGGEDDGGRLAEQLDELCRDLDRGSLKAPAL